MSEDLFYPTFSNMVTGTIDVSQLAAMYVSKRDPGRIAMATHNGVPLRINLITGTCSFGGHSASSEHIAEGRSGMARQVARMRAKAWRRLMRKMRIGGRP